MQTQQPSPKCKKDHLFENEYSSDVYLFVVLCTTTIQIVYQVQNKRYTISQIMEVMVSVRNTHLFCQKGILFAYGKWNDIILMCKDLLRYVSLIFGVIFSCKKFENVILLKKSLINNIELLYFTINIFIFFSAQKIQQ